MTLKQYSEFRKKTKKNAIVDRIEYLGLGVAGESGEVADAIKKYLRERDTCTSKEFMTLTHNIIEELGDVMWYWIGLCEYLGVTPEHVMDLNKKKLTKRYLNK